MGGSVNAGSFISPPSNVLPEQLLTMGQGLGQQTQNLRNQALMWQAQHPTQSYMPNLPGMQKLAEQEAYLNAANSQALEKAMSPDAAALRQALPKQLASDLTAASGVGASSPYTQQNLAQLFGSGMQDSTIGKSAYFDTNTAQGLARKQAAEQAAANYLAQNQAPTAGLDPGALVSAQQAAQAQAVQNANANQANIMGSTQANLQSTSDWINSQMANASQAVGANQQNWQNYQQALLNAAAGNRASQNATTGALVSAAGTIGGAALGGGFGGVLGNALAQGINQGTGLNSSPFSSSSTVENGGPASIGGYYASPQAAYNAYSTGNAAQGSPMISPASTPGMYTMSGWRMPGQ